MPELVLKLGDSVVQTYVFDKDIMGIGRSRDNDIVIENLSVSRNHARIRNQAGKYVLTDLNSANGTYVNGVKVTKTEIVDSDVIAVGKHKLHFVSRVVSEEEMIVDAFGQDRTMMVDRAPQPVLCVTEGRLKGTEFPVTKFETAIGKAHDNDIVIGDDWFLSKKQAVIYKKGTDYEVHDFGGFRKTKVNGQPLNDPHRLKPGDVIELGNTKCVFQYAGDAPPSGRVPQEIAPEDSIYSTGQRYEALPPLQAQPAATERDESSEGYVVEGMPEIHQPALAGLSEAWKPLAPQSHDGAEENGSGNRQSIEVEEVAVAAPLEVEAPAPPPPPSGGSKKRSKRDRLREAAAAAQRPGNGASAYGVADPADALDTAPPPAPAEEPVVEELPADETPIKLPFLDKPADEALAAQEAAGSHNGAARSPEPVVEADEPAALPAPTEEKVLRSSGPLQWSGDGKSDEEIATDPDLQREVALWESAVDNKSSIIRRQAARNLKKLTGRDYEI